MNDDTPSPPPLTDAELRRRRQAEALRANLARRKTQGRARAAEEAEGGGDALASGLQGAETDATTGG